MTPMYMLIECCMQFYFCFVFYLVADIGDKHIAGFLLYVCYCGHGVYVVTSL